MWGRLFGDPKAPFEGTSTGNSVRNASGISRTTLNLSRTKTIFTRAAGVGNLKRVQLLITEGRVSQREKDIGLGNACLYGHLEVVRFLVENGVNVNAVTATDGTTPLMMACERGHLEIVRLLVERGANVNAATSNDGGTALMMASQNDHLEIVRYLVERGANVNAATSTYGGTALMWACMDGNLKMVRYLVERGGANVNATTTDGHTALMWACEKGHLEIVRCLVEHGGANVNLARTNDGMTALMWACQNGNLEIVRLLVERGGANVNAATSIYGGTALMWASGNGHLKIVRYLVEHGANVNAAVSHGLTAIDFANTEEIKTYLKEATKRGPVRSVMNPLAVLEAPAAAPVLPPLSSLRGSQVEPASRVVMNPLRSTANPFAGLSAEIQEALGIAPSVVGSLPPLLNRAHQRLNPLSLPPLGGPRGGRRISMRKKMTRRSRR